MSEPPSVPSSATSASPSGGLSFSGVVGQDDAKLALVLAACEPRLGGVLLRGQKGSAKTTLARGLSSLLAGDAPFIELPLGATEDRVIGSIDAAELLASGTVRVRPGLMAAADGGVLYVDEVNLLADHLVDSLLDASVSGRNRIERDGVSHSHDARFVLVGSMNPEEGELRPQLLDRFGLAVDITMSTDVDERTRAVRRQLDHERGGPDHSFAEADGRLADRIAGFSPAAVPDETVEVASRMALAVGAEGLRADLMLCRAAATLAGFEGRPAAGVDDLRRVAPMVLSHRRRRQPFDDPGLSDADLDRAVDEAVDETFDPPDSDPPEDGSPDGDSPDNDAVDRTEVMGADGELAPPVAMRPSTPAPEAPLASHGKSASSQGPRGRFVRAEVATGPISDVAVIPTALATATRRRAEPGTAVHRDDLRTAVRSDVAGRLVVIAVDASGSMGAERRMATAKAAVMGLLTDAYQQRDRVALVTVAGEAAEVSLRPTGSVEIARRRLIDLPVGGPTPLAHGI
ncbi:MAG: AAA family ATPase, partial [Acidimicrobiales bacterium]